MDAFTLGHRKTLDGLRGLSILLVYLYHASLTRFGGGFLGVDLFFVLSGFLITTLLLEERRETGGISLGAFYARRALRLLPALMLVLAVMLGVSATRETPEEFGRMARAAAIVFLYCSNWFLIANLFPRVELSHAWSLSVEEQFYLIWPILLILLLRTKGSRRTAALVIAAALLVLEIVRAAMWVRGPSFPSAYLGLHFDGLLAGGLAGMAASWGVVRPGGSAMRGVRAAGLVTLGCLGFLVPFGWVGDPWLYLGGYFFVNAGLACLVLSMTLDPWRPLRLIFESPPLVWLGRLSYAIYLWHVPAYWLSTSTHGSAPAGGTPAWAVPLAVPLAVTLGGATVSYYAVERPLLRLKRRFERVRRSAP